MDSLLPWFLESFQTFADRIRRDSRRAKHLNFSLVVREDINFVGISSPFQPLFLLGIAEARFSIHTHSDISAVGSIWLSYVSLEPYLGTEARSKKEVSLRLTGLVIELNLLISHSIGIC